MPSVLVIDDEPAVRDSIRLVLGRAGYSVSTADNGIDGIAAYFARPAELVIVDIVMPRSNGIEVIRKIRARFPGARILAMTGGGNFGPLGEQAEAIVTDAYLASATRSGADAVMTKPFHRTQLLERVGGLIKN